MKKYITLAACSLFLFIACQKEISVEVGRMSEGSLAKDGQGNCIPVSAGGNYVADKPLNDSNYLLVEVNVSTTGNYFIYTDTLNGYNFSATGNFANAGTVTVRLNALGKPVASGTNRFTIRYNTSQCLADVMVSKNLSSPADFTFAGSPGACMNSSLQGSYIAAYALDSAAKVNLQVMVTSPGTYSIITNTVNGYRFTGSGVFTTTGTQSIILSATGIPGSAGTNVFSVTAGTSACSFSVTVTVPLATIGNDYFPLTYQSFWVYNRSDFANDSVKRTVADSVMQNGKLYKKTDEYFPFAGGPLYFRKASNDYYEYGRVDKFTASFQYAGSVNGDILFLKENITTGTVWMSEEYTGTATFGQTIMLRYRFECVDANSVATVNGNTFGNVYKIRMLPQIASVGNNWGSTFEQYDLYYAKGVGLIYATKALNGFTQYQQTLKRWLVY